MPTSAHEIAGVLLHAGAVFLRPEEPFTFGSGLRSPIYCDNRLLIGNVAARRAVMAAYEAHCAGAEVVAGLATGGIPWSAWVAEALSLPMAYVRASAKGHGRGQQIEGARVNGRRVVLIEDTISTGGSVLEAADALRADGAILLRCVCIFTWGWEKTRSAFAEAALPVEALTTLPELLEVVADEEYLPASQQAIVEDWASDPSGWGARTLR
jgi:orotate phosphoribosyltransferase